MSSECFCPEWRILSIGENLENSKLLLLSLLAEFNKGSSIFRSRSIATSTGYGFSLLPKARRKYSMKGSYLCYRSFPPPQHFDAVFFIHLIGCSWCVKEKKDVDHPSFMRHLRNGKSITCSFLPSQQHKTNPSEVRVCRTPSSRVSRCSEFKTCLVRFPFSNIRRVRCTKATPSIITSTKYHTYHSQRLINHLKWQS